MRARGDDLVNPADLLELLRVTYTCLVYAWLLPVVSRGKHSNFFVLQ
jgi:hypothetical protein